MSTEPNTAPVVLPPAAPQRLVAVDDSSFSGLVDTSRFEQMLRVAKLMASSSLIPKHLTGAGGERATANCFLVVNQAMLWRRDPLTVAQETYEVQGKMGYSGKLIAAIVNGSSELEGKLDYKFAGTADKLTVTVSGRLRGEPEARTITLSVGQAKTSNQMWTKDPEQKLVYSGATKWARRHMPHILLGIATDDDVQAMADERVGSIAAPKSLAQIAERGAAMDFEEPALAEVVDAPQPEPEPVVEPAPKKRTTKMTAAEMEAALATTPVKRDVMFGDEGGGDQA